MAAAVNQATGSDRIGSDPGRSVGLYEVPVGTGSVSMSALVLVGSTRRHTDKRRRTLD